MGATAHDPKAGKMVSKLTLTKICKSIDRERPVMALCCEDADKRLKIC